MDTVPNIPPLFWVTVGGILQAATFLRTKEDIAIFFMAVVFSLVGFAPGKNEHDYNVSSHLGEYLFFFVLTCFAALRSRILARVNELSLIILTILFWVIISSSGLPPLPLPIFFLALVPTAVTFVITVYPHELPDPLQVVLYVWAQCIGIIVALAQYQKVGEVMFGSVNSLGVADLITSGMVMFLVGIQLLSIVYLIPIPGKRQSLSDRLEEVRRYIGELVQKFGDEQLDWRIALTIVFGIAGLLYVNNRWHFLSEALLINLLFLGAQGFSFLLKPPVPKPGEETGHPAASRREFRP